MVHIADNRKEVERAELHRTIWKIADELRGSVDGWDFKQYVLGMLFYRYISENLSNYINKVEDDKNLNETLSKLFKSIEASAVGRESLIFL